MNGARLPYSLDEDKKIIQYLLENNFEGTWSGNTVWKLMAREQICPGRSWESMKNRYKRYIKQEFRRPKYNLTAEEKEALQASFTRNLDDRPKHRADRRLILRYADANRAQDQRFVDSSDSD